VQWLDIGIVPPAAGQAVASGANCLYFGRYARSTTSRARRVAAATLALVNASLLAEASLFLLYGSREVRDAGPAIVAATLLLRWLLLGAASLISLLIWRSPLRPAKAARDDPRPGD
jgi:hypothetical protein